MVLSHEPFVESNDVEDLIFDFNILFSSFNALISCSSFNTIPSCSFSRPSIGFSWSGKRREVLGETEETMEFVRECGRFIFELSDLSWQLLGGENRSWDDIREQCFRQQLCYRM